MFHGRVGCDVLLSGLVERDGLERFAEAGLVHGARCLVDKPAVHEEFEEAAQELLLRVVELLVLVRLLKIDDRVALCAVVIRGGVQLVAAVAGDRP